jgi:hypothetical protein
MNKPKIKLGLLKPEPNLIPEPINQQFYSLNKLNEYLKELVENNVFFMFVELMKQMSIDYADQGIQFEDLKERYLSYFKKNLKNSNLYCDFLSLNLNRVDLNNITEISRPEIPPPSMISDQEIIEVKCYARTANNSQCSRKKQKGCDFCGSHTHSQPYGRVDQPTISDSRPKKRGRPLKCINF